MSPAGSESDSRGARGDFSLSSLVGSLVVDLVYLALSPLLVIVWLVASRGLTRPKLRRGLLRKFGVGAWSRRRGDRPAVWVHAVSVGEVVLAETLLRGWRERFPDHEIILSTSTYTGRETALKRFRDVHVVWAPVDLSWVVSLACRRLRPHALILVELELWPNLLLVAKRRGIPTFVVNGRMTERSCSRYERAGPLARALFRQVRAFAVQQEEYAGRFRRLGVSGARLAVLGSLKYDRRPAATPEIGRAIRDRLGLSPDHVVVVVGSTHPGEEALFLHAWPAVRAASPEARLVIVPRHVERLADEGEIDRWGAPLRLERWSRLPSPPPGHEFVLVVDTVGELEAFYAAGDVGVVAGSFLARGGHNVLEPARLGRPVVFGPHTENFRDEAAHLLARGGATVVDGEDSIRTELVALVGDGASRAERGERAKDAVTVLEGALARHVEWLAREIQLFHSR